MPAIGSQILGFAKRKSLLECRDDVSLYGEQRDLIVLESGN